MAGETPRVRPNVPCAAPAGDDNAARIRDQHDLGQHPRQQRIDDYRDQHGRLEYRPAADRCRQQGFEWTEKEVGQTVNEAAEWGIGIRPEHLEDQANEEQAVDDPKDEVDDLNRAPAWRYPAHDLRGVFGERRPRGRYTRFLTQSSCWLIPYDVGVTTFH
jgi:hypothetical protein